MSYNENRTTREAASAGFVIHKFTPREKNTLRGFLTIGLSLVIHDITLHEKNGSRWVSMPAREFQKDGERSWMPLIEDAGKSIREIGEALNLSHGTVQRAIEARQG